MSQFQGIRFIVNESMPSNMALMIARERYGGMMAGFDPRRVIVLDTRDDNDWPWTAEQTAERLPEGSDAR